MSGVPVSVSSLVPPRDGGERLQVRMLAVSGWAPPHNGDERALRERLRSLGPVPPRDGGERQWQMLRAAGRIQPERCRPI